MSSLCVIIQVANVKPQFDLRFVLRAITFVGVALAWCTTFWDVFGSSRHVVLDLLPYSLFTLTLITLACITARQPEKEVSAMCWLTLAWQVGMLDAVDGMIGSFQWLGAEPIGSVIYAKMYFECVRALTLPLFGTLLFGLMIRETQSGNPLIRLLLIATVTVGIFDVIAILICHEAILEFC